MSFLISYRVLEKNELEASGSKSVVQYQSGLLGRQGIANREID